MVFLLGVEVVHIDLGGEILTRDIRMSLYRVSAIPVAREAWKEQVPIRPRGSAPAWGALCRVEIADYFADPKPTIQLTLYDSERKTSSPA